MIDPRMWVVLGLVVGFGLWTAAVWSYSGHVHVTDYKQELADEAAKRQADADAAAAENEKVKTAHEAEARERTKEVTTYALSDPARLSCLDAAGLRLFNAGADRLPVPAR